jgi:hypothetical protein
MHAVMTVPLKVRVAVGLAILGIGTSLAFMAMPGTTTTVRVVSGVACAACLVVVAIVWRQIGMNQKFDLAMEKDRALQALRRLQSKTNNFSLTSMYTFAIDEVKTVKEAREIRENIEVIYRNNNPYNNNESRRARVV